MTGHIVRRGADSWRIVVELPRDAVTGRRRQQRFTTRGTKKEAERALVDALRRRDRGIDIEPTRVTVAEYLERWLKDYAEQNVAPSTLQRYKQIVRRLSPLIGGVRLQEVRPTQLQAAYAELGRDGLAARTVLHHHRVLKEALKHAVGWQLLEQNPAEAVRAPRPERPEMRSLNPGEVAQLLDACGDDDLRRLVFTAVSTGLRLGELLGLRWSDVDLEGGAVTIGRTAQYLGPDGVQLRTPKTPRSRRTISLSASTVATLREHKVAQNKRRLRLGPGFQDGGFVFAAPDGRVLAPYSVSEPFRRAIEGAGLSGVRFHDLRHTSATLSLLAGVPAKVVSDRLGHTSVAFTLDTYAHVLPEQQREAAQALDRILPKPLRRVGESKS